MQKIAQKRSFKQKLKETFTGGSIERAGLKDVMNTLRNLDDQIRTIVLGKQVGNGKVRGAAISMADMLKNIKTLCNRREYLEAGARLDMFNGKMDIISEQLLTAQLDVMTAYKEIERQILLGKKNLPTNLLEDPTEREAKKKSLRALFPTSQTKPPLGAAAARRERNRIILKQSSRINYSAFVKQAGILDTMHNVFSERGRLLSKWEDLNPTGFEKIKKDTLFQLQAAQNIFSLILNSLEKMGDLRADRNIPGYVDVAGELLTAYQTYDASFDTYYKTHLLPFAIILKQRRQSPATAPVISTPLPGYRSPFGGPGGTGPTGTIQGSPLLGDPLSATVDDSSLGGGERGGGKGFPPNSNVPRQPTKEEIDAALSGQSLTGQPVQSERGTFLNTAEYYDFTNRGKTPPPGTPVNVVSGTGPADYVYVGQTSSGDKYIVDSNGTPVLDGDGNPKPFRFNLGQHYKAAFKKIEEPTSAPPAPASESPSAPQGPGLPPSKGQHFSFVESLESLSQESPLIISSFMKKYANQIKNSDPAFAQKLFAIANCLK